MRLLLLEPYDRESHRALTRALTEGLAAQWTALTLPGRHFRWRMRGAAAWFALEQRDRLTAPHDALIATAALPLAELLGLVPALAAIPRVLFFHDNQLAWPVFDEATARRDLHFGFTQLVSALVADRCVFNSRFNRDSFLEAGRDLLGRMPDAVPAGWIERIEERSQVLPVPLDLTDEGPPPDANEQCDRQAGPLVLWNHRWEQDKDPEAFFAVLFELCERAVPLRVAVCGESFRRVPPIFEEARARLGSRIVHWGWLEDRAAYLRLLGQADLVVSTARQEFQGLAVLEAVHCGARPVVPDRLAYREIYPSQYRYGTDTDLTDLLEALCRQWSRGDLALRADRRELTRPFLAAAILPRWSALFEELGAGAA